MKHETHQTGGGALRGSLRFWGRTCLENIAMAVVAAAGLMVFRMMSVSASGEGAGDMLLGEVSLFPYLLAGTGVLVVMMTVMGCFQTYFSVLLSMNVTRGTAIGGIWGSQLATAAGLLGCMALIWKLAAGEIASVGMAILPLVAGVFLIAAAVSMLLGVGTLRWGRIGTIIGVLSFMVMGGCVGAFIAMTGDSFLLETYVSREMMAGWNCWLLLAGGGAFYAAAGAFAFAVLRKAEVRI